MDIILNYPVELKRYYFNKLIVTDNLTVDLFINVPYTVFKLYNLINCNIGGDNDDYFYYIRTSKVKSCKLFGILMERQHNIY
jgi:hypothetical protein